MLSLVSERDWLGIFIELAIVTVGVILAFRVDQWGQDRRQAREERQFLNRMWKETSDIAAESQEAAQADQKEATALRAAYDARGDVRQVRILDAQVGGSACRIFNLPSLGISDTTAQELLNSGRLDIVSNAGLRNALRVLAASQAEAAGQLVYARQIVPMIDQNLDKYMIASLDSSGRNTCRFQWSNALADPVAVYAILRARRVHELMGDERKTISLRAADVHRALACSLGKPDCGR